MNIKLFNLCMLLGWLLILVGGVMVDPGWGLAIAGAVLMLLTLASAYLAGFVGTTGPAADGKAKTGESA